MNNDPLKTARDILAEMTDCHERSMDDIMATTQVGILAALIALCDGSTTGLSPSAVLTNHSTRCADELHA